MIFNYCTASSRLLSFVAPSRRHRGYDSLSWITCVHFHISLVTHMILVNILCFIKEKSCIVSILISIWDLWGIPKHHFPRRWESEIYGRPLYHMARRVKPKLDRCGYGVEVDSDFLTICWGMLLLMIYHENSF